MDNTMTQAQISELVDLKVQAALTNFAVTLPTLSDMHQIALLEIRSWVKNKAELAKLDLLSAELQKEMDKLAALCQTPKPVLMDTDLAGILHECGLLKNPWPELSEAATRAVIDATHRINEFLQGESA